MILRRLCSGLAIMTAFLPTGVGHAAGSERESHRRPAETRNSAPSDKLHLRGPGDVAPESHVPPRSPDLGLPTRPLSPSTVGPGSGLLGVEAGRIPPPAGPARELEQSPARRRE